MLNNKIRRVIVADNDQALGIITVTDFVKHLNTILAETENYSKDSMKIYLMNTSIGIINLF